MTETQSRFAKKRLAMILAGGIAGVVVGLAGVYGVSTLTRNAGGDAVCRPAVELAMKIAPFARGEVAAVNVAKSPLKVPDLAFQDSTGKPLTLEHWRGRTVLLNLSGRGDKDVDTAARWFNLVTAEEVAQAELVRAREGEQS